MKTWSVLAFWGSGKHKAGEGGGLVVHVVTRATLNFRDLIAVVRKRINDMHYDLFISFDKCLPR